MQVRSARFPELTGQQLYAILRLRAEVFVVEQGCVYLDTDGRDIEPTTTHFWIEARDGSVIAVLRLLRSKPGSEIGRVATRPDHREQGHATRLLLHALRVAPSPTRINAQSRLAPWYERFGFVADGEEFVEDGIPHVPMIRSGKVP